MTTYKAAQDPDVRPQPQRTASRWRSQRTFQTCLAAFGLLVMMVSFGASSALAAGEAHPLVGEFGSFSNPNGIAVDESTGDVYVADIGADIVYKFDASGNPVDFSAVGLGSTNELTGGATLATSFSFPNVYGTPAAIAVDNSKSPSDPSAGDLYVMDAGHGVIDKFSPSGEYISQIAGFAPATGSAENELLGLGVDGSGTVHVDLRSAPEHPLIEEFDGEAVNQLVARQQWETWNARNDIGNVGLSPEPQAHGFAVSVTGDDYPVYEPSCSCTVKFGQRLSALGRVDGSGNARGNAGEAGDVAVAVDSATGHLFADDQSSVAEWDTGAMNRNSVFNSSAGTLVARFGSSELSGTSGQGGIAVDGATGEIYLARPGANPGEGKVYVFASDTPAVTTSAASGVTREAASLSGMVDPRGVAVSSCEFEYGVTDEFGNGPYGHSVPCKQTPGEIGALQQPVAVSAQLEGLKPGELYHFRLVATDANGAGEGSGLVATQGVGFGIKSFEVNFLNEDGTPDTQAGSHPFRFVDSFEMNSHFKRAESNADSPYIRLPDGALRDVTVDLPPGFVGDPNVTSKKCTGEELREPELRPGFCPHESIVGFLELNFGGGVSRSSGETGVIASMVPPRGVALQLGANFFLPLLYINNGVLAGGDYPVQATVTDAPGTAPVIESKVKIYGVITPCVQVQSGSGKYADFSCSAEDTAFDGRGEWEKEPAGSKAFLTMPTGCHGPLRSTMAADSWEEPGQWAKATSITRNSAGTPVSLTGCSKLRFPPTIEVKPDVPDASTSTGLTVGVHVPQTTIFNPDGLAESSLRDTTVTLPEGVAINPAGGNGLEACSEGLAGFTGFSEFNSEYEPDVKTATFTPTLPGGIAAAEAGETAALQPGVNFCPNGSKIGTVKIKTPLLANPLEGAVYLAAQNANPFGSVVAMYMIVEDPVSGSIVKLTGEVHLSETGQIVTTFKNTPDLPFEDLELHFFGGERAPLTTPSRCGTYTTTASFVPWDGNGPVEASSSFQITSGPNGSPCPGAGLPFSPSLTGGATNIQAGAFSPLTLTMTRKDGEQNLQSVEATLPPGLSGILSNIEECPEPQANLGECPPNSLIGETTISVGVGGDPFSVSGGKFYLTGPYNGSGGCTVGTSGCAPFGITFEVPAKAGPFDLKRNSANPAGEDPCDCVIVRGKIEVNPLTAAIKITSDPPGSPYAIPTSIEGIPLEIQHVNAITTRGDFQFNPTNCDKMAVTGTIHSSEGGSETLGVPFQVTNCAALEFEPKFSVATSAKTSRADGASLSVKLTYPSAPFGSQANVKQVKVELPKALPSRLTTLQKACTAAQFDANPAGCPAASIVGHAKAITPLVPVPLEGPAYFVSNGGEAFPNLIVVLQGYGVTIDLVGDTFISKAGVTSSTFETVPDQPVTSFELTLPEGPYSALTAPGNLCTAKNLTMPTEFLAQNGAVLKQSTKIAVTGCPKIKKTTHKKKHKHKAKAKYKRVKRGKRKKR
jgi:DNA-binding beta-propeller fold protein YncE